MEKEYYVLDVLTEENILKLQEVGKNPSDAFEYRVSESDSKDFSALLAEAESEQTPLIIRLNI